MKALGIYRVICNTRLPCFYKRKATFAQACSILDEGKDERFFEKCLEVFKEVHAVLQNLSPNGISRAASTL